MWEYKPMKVTETSYTSNGNFGIQNWFIQIKALCMLTTTNIDTVSQVNQWEKQAGFTWATKIRTIRQKTGAYGKVTITISDLSDVPGYNSSFLGLHLSPPVLTSGLDFGTSGRSTPTQSQRLELDTRLC